MRLLLRLFPRRVRERHGDEMLELTATGDARARDVADLVLSALMLRSRDFADRFRGQSGLVALAFPLALLAAAATGAALGDCVVVGSVFTAATGVLAALPPARSRPGLVAG